MISLRQDHESGDCQLYEQNPKGVTRGGRGRNGARLRGFPVPVAFAIGVALVVIVILYLAQPPWPCPVLSGEGTV